MGASLTWAQMEAKADRLKVRALTEIQRIEHDQREKAKKLERDYAKRLATVNLHANALAAAGRLRDPGRSDCDGSDCACTGTAGRKLSAEFDAFLKREARRADELHEYAMTCWKFVNGVE